MDYFVLSVMLLFSFTVHAQQAVLQGQVLDKNSGEEIIGANVMLLDDLGSVVMGFASDFDGNYRIAVEPRTYTLRCTFIGYELKEVELKAETRRIDIQIEEDGTQIQSLEIQVNSSIKRLKPKKRLFGKAFAKPKMD